MGPDADDDVDSDTSFPIREKYTSTGTIDNFSLDTAITLPSTPQQAELEEKLRLLKEDMQGQLEKQKKEYQESLRAAEAANVEIEEIRAEKAKMEEKLLAAKEEMQKQLELQKEEFETRLASLDPAKMNTAIRELTDREIAIAKSVTRHWRQRKYVRMAEAILQYAATIKEAQVMSQEMDKNVVFQFAIVDVGHSMASSYDLVLNGISGEDDTFLEDAPKPCVGVRVLDYKHCVVHLWSLEKLQNRVRLMRQMHQYLDRPEYLQHFRLENPFSETCLPQYSLIGDVDIPLTAVFESRVQDFTLDVISPYTSNVVGIVRLSLEPSSAQAPLSTLKFNVVMRDMVGFPEREGTDVHAQLFIPGISEDGGATTTHMIKDFDEGPVRFDSVHSMSLPLSSPRTMTLKVSMFSKVTVMHLDKLLSWDDMRDSRQQPSRKRKNARIPESEFYIEEKHDVFARVQVQELAENGQYLPVDVTQANDLDSGTFQLHQGLQRRIVVSLTHSSGEALQWQDISSLRIGRVQLVDPMGKVPDLGSPTPMIPLKPVGKPTVRNNANGTSNVILIGQWDSSLHDSLLLDRTTADKYRIQMDLLWNVTAAKLADPIVFSLGLALQILPRSSVRSPSLFASLWATTRVMHSSVCQFSLAIRPLSAKRAVDLWRMNTQYDYVKGEELLTGWTPRGVSLVRDYISARKRRRRVAEIETARGVLSSRALSPPHNGTTTPDDTERQEAVLQKYVQLWATRKDPGEIILVRENTEPPQNGAAFAGGAAGGSDTPTEPPRLVAEVRVVEKNPMVLKAGYLLMPNEANTKWVRRYLELRRPYLHVRGVPDGDEVGAVNLSNSRIDHQPQIAKLLLRENVFAVYAPQNTYLFAARSERERIEWILKIDQSYFSGNVSPEA
jgi:kinesin family protein 1